jgi:hypothetical protein
MRIPIKTIRVIKKPDSGENTKSIPHGGPHPAIFSTIAPFAIVYDNKFTAKYPRYTNTNPGIILTDSFHNFPNSGIKNAANKGIAINNTGLPTILNSLFRQLKLFYDVCKV